MGAIWIKVGKLDSCARFRFRARADHRMLQCTLMTCHRFPSLMGAVHLQNHDKLPGRERDAKRICKKELWIASLQMRLSLIP
jgi:hypothetical protein